MSEEIPGPLPATHELMAALAKAQAEMDNAPMLSENPHFRSKYADLASIRNATIPALSKHGLSLHQVTRIDGSGMVLVTRLGHASGQFIDSVYPLPNSNKPHEMGSAITYARRYSWAAICGIAAEADDDGNEAQEGSKNGNTERAARAVDNQVRQVQARKSSAAAKRDGDWPRFEQALRDCQSAREVEKLRAEYQAHQYHAWNQDWQATAEQEFAKRLAEFSQPGALKQTLQDSIEATDEQTAKFHECWEWLANATTLNEIISRADNPGYREGLKTLTKEQVAQLRALFKARRETLGAQVE